MLLCLFFPSPFTPLPFSASVPLSLCLFPSSPRNATYAFFSRKRCLTLASLEVCSSHRIRKKPTSAAKPFSLLYATPLHSSLEKKSSASHSSFFFFRSQDNYVLTSVASMHVECYSLSDRNLPRTICCAEGSAPGDMGDFSLSYDGLLAGVSHHRSAIRFWDYCTGTEVRRVQLASSSDLQGSLVRVFPYCAIVKRVCMCVS